MTNEFSPAGYKSLIERILSLGYRSVSFDDVDPHKPHLLIRHDLDMSLLAAEIIAECEHHLGVSAVYFVLMRTEMYNAMSRDGRRSISRLVTLGHEIGLHFDASEFEEGMQQMDAAANQECDFLQQITGKPVNIVSFHRPSQRLLGNADRIAGRDHTYMPLYFNDVGYCSDSQGRWRFGHPLDHTAIKEGRALQLLTHPIWWQERGGLDLVTRLNAFLEARSIKLRRELGANCIPFRDHVDQTQDSEDS